MAEEKIWCYFGVTQLDLVKPKRKSFKTTSAYYEDPNLSHQEKQSNETQDHDGGPRDCVLQDFGHLPHDHFELYPHEAKFLMDHVLYLPVHKRVRLNDLELLCQAVMKVAQRRHPGVMTSKEVLNKQRNLKSRL